jgi:hypothetical protein
VANFGQLHDNESALKFRDDLGRKLENLQGIKVPANYQELWLSIPPEKWTPVADKIIEALNGLLQEQT